MNAQTAHILVVDDEKLTEFMILQTFRRQIRDQTYHFSFALNGLAALEALATDTKIDMILTDIRMPEMDGLTLLEKLKELNKDIKAVVISAYGDMRNIRMAMNRGAFDFLTKPIDLEDLEHTIQRTLDHVAQIQREQNQLRQAQEQLRYFAFHDVLTNLANRTWFMRQLDRAIELHQFNPEHSYTVLLLDIDRFKAINDSYGHLVGDYLLISVGARLQDCLHPSDTIARLGGDEFIILLEGRHDISSVLQLIQRVQLSLRPPFMIGEHQIHLSSSIGITTHDIGYRNAVEALRDASATMYRAKRNPEGYATFDPSMHAHITERLQFENSVRQGIAQGQFFNFYQPIVELQTGSLLGFEMLARWQHPQHGWISPAKFISVAEEVGLIQELSRQLLREGCQQLKEWQAAFPNQSLLLHINVSPIQLRAATFVSQLQEVLTSYDLSGQHFRLELTESALLDDVQTYTTAIVELLDMGLQLCIDDFGTGYSSLKRLHDFPITTMKIDQSFIRQMITSQPHLATIKMIIVLAKMLDMDVVAEGIETTDEAQLLIDLGCSIGQGYLIARPMASEAATSYLITQQLGAHPIIG